MVIERIVLSTTLEEAIELASHSDYEVVSTLASYCFDQNEYNEARTWYCRTAECGLVKAFIPAALLTSMLSRGALKASGGDAIHGQDVYDLTGALQWIDRAGANDMGTDADGSVVRERALCAYAASKKDGTSITAEDVIAYLKEGYATSDKTPEAEIYLAFALYEATQLFSAGASLCFNLLRHYRSYTEKGEPDVNLGIPDAYLGFRYLEGNGCSVDDNASYDCFLRAGQKGLTVRISSVASRRRCSAATNSRGCVQQALATAFPSMTDHSSAQCRPPFHSRPTTQI